MTRIRLVALILTLAAAGCLDGERTVLFQYERTQDEFAFLTVYQHIRERDSSPAEDADYLLRIYRNRDHLIIGPFCIDIFGGHRQLIRLADQSAAVINFASESDRVGVVTSSFDLNAIKILPGEFFQEGEGSLCYYHQTVVPGKAVDGLLRELTRYLGDVIREHPDALGPLDQELAQRQAGGGQMDWERFTSTIVDGLKVSPYTIPNPGDPLDTASIQAVRDALAAGRIDPRRRGAEIVVRIGLSGRDVAGVVDCYARVRAAVRAEADRRLAINEAAAAPLVKAGKAMDIVSVLAGDSRVLEVGIDLPMAFEFAREEMGEPPALNDDEKAAARHMLGLVGGQVDVDQTLTVEHVEEDFRAGRLASHPQVPEVSPGKGLIRARPTTER